MRVAGAVTLYFLLYTDCSLCLSLSLESTSSGRDLVSHLLPLNPACDTILTIATTSGKTVNIPPNKALAVSRHA